MPTHLRRAAAAVGAPAPDLPKALTDDGLLTQAQLKRLAGNISDMSVWRWRRAGLLPEPVRIRGRNYWRVHDAHAALARLMGRPDGGGQ